MANRRISYCQKPLKQSQPKTTTMFEDFLKAVGAIIVGMALIFGVSVLSGTLLWAIYPHIHTIFPTAAANGIIATKLDWWDAVCVTWIFGILIKGGSSSSTKKEK
jgi:hypothetical protein